MYKKTSASLQRKADKALALDYIPQNIDELEDYLTTKEERRKFLGQQKQLLCNRISTIKQALGVAPDVMFKQVKGATQKNPLYEDWNDYRQHLHDVDAELKEMKAFKGITLQGYIINALKEDYQSLFNEIKEIAYRKLIGDLEKNKEANANRPTNS